MIATTATTPSLATGVQTWNNESNNHKINNNNNKNSIYFKNSNNNSSNNNNSTSLMSLAYFSHHQVDDIASPTLSAVTVFIFSLPFNIVIFL